MSTLTEPQVTALERLTPVSVRWDWYGASVVERGEHVVELLRAGLGADDVRLHEKARQGYAIRWELRRNDHRVAEVLAGGQNPGCYVLGTGEDAQEVADVLRGQGAVAGGSLVHGVSRADVAVDVDQPGAWDRLTTAARALALRSGLQMQLWQDPEREEEGRTLYVGSRKSRAFVRIYEKGKQVGDDSRPDWVRFELEVKPGDRTGKRELAELSPLAALGASRWVREFVHEQFKEMTVGAALTRSRTVGDTERARAALLAQWSGVLLEWADEVGGAEALGRTLVRKAGR